MVPLHPGPENGLDKTDVGFRLRGGRHFQPFVEDFRANEVKDVIRLLQLVAIGFYIYVAGLCRVEDFLRSTVFFQHRLYLLPYFRPGRGVFLVSHLSLPLRFMPEKSGMVILPSFWAS